MDDFDRQNLLQQGRIASPDQLFQTAGLQGAPGGSVGRPAQGLIALQVARAFLGRGPGPERPLGLETVEALRGEGLLGAYCHLLGRHPEVKPAYLELVNADGRMRSFLGELDEGLQHPAIAFKGAAYLGWLYRLGQRHVGDVDLVGGPEVRRDLERMGFRLVSEQPLVLRKDGFMVDLHNHPLGRQQRVIRWDLGRAGRRSLPLFEGARRLRRFDLRDEGVLSLMHGAKHAFSRLVWLVDLALLRPDPGFLEQLGARRYGWYGAALLDRLFGIPGEVGPLHCTEHWFLERVERRRAPETLGMLLPLHTLPGVGSKLAYLRETLRPQGPGGWPRRLRELAGMVGQLRRNSRSRNTRTCDD